MNPFKSFLKKTIKPVARASYYLSKSSHQIAGIKDGVTAVVVARNESYSLLMSLGSLVGFADEIICIDNGSTDDTLQKMQSFQKKYNSRLKVEVIEAPGKLLGDCRNIGLEQSTYSWHLRWDADMVFRQNAGKYNAVWLKEKIQKIKFPAAIKLSRINLSGDLHHVSQLHDPVDDGEFFLVKRTKSLAYREVHKFDVLQFPVFYKEIKIAEPVIFHLNLLKPLERIMYRNIYFSWRKSEIGSDKKQSFESFKKNWELNMFGTNEPDALKYRFQKKFVLLNSKPFDAQRYGPYPEQVELEIEKGNERFHFVYENNRVVERKDEEDFGFNNYIPTKEDLEWSVEEHLKKLLSKEKLKKIGIS